MKVIDFTKEQTKDVTTILVAIENVEPWIYICTQDEFCEWIEKQESLAEYEQPGYSDDGDGEYSKGKFIDWDIVLDDFLNVEFLEKYIISNNIKVMP